jgi:HK97 family phage prohead protease
MPFQPNERVYRSMALLESRMDNADPLAPKYRVEGYASTFERYKLFDDYDGPIYEQIDKRAFDGADMTDVIMQYDHQGRVFARNKNNTLTVTPDDHGLLIEANLGGTELGRQLYEEIRGGYTDKMSFGFTVDAEDILDTKTEDGKALTVRTITSIRKLYDVSAVSIPANDATEISVRSLADGEIERLKAERLEAEEEALERRRAEIKARALGGK